MKQQALLLSSLLLLIVCSTLVSGVATQHELGSSSTGGVSVHLHSPVLGFEPEAFKDMVEELMQTSNVLNPSNDTAFDHLPGGRLSNLFVRLQRYLFATRVLPADGSWGRIPPNVERGYESPFPQLSRLSINRFWDDVKDNIPPNSRCLELVPAHYSAKHSHCVEVWSMDYEGDHTKQRYDATTKTVFGDLMNFTMSDLFNMFDAVVVTNAIHLPADPYEAFGNLYRLLKPGGQLITTQPFIERDVTSFVYYPDAFRFSDRIVNRMLEETGFEIVRAYRAGNTMLTTGFLLGFGSADYSANELEAALLPTLRGDDGYYGTCYLARKPHGGAASSSAAQAASAAAAEAGVEHNAVGRASERRRHASS